MVARFLKTLSLLFALSLLPVAALAAQQTLLEPRYCFNGACFPTLSQAEAELRAKAGSYGALWTRDRVYPYMGSGPSAVFRHAYVVKDQEAQIMYKPGYGTGGDPVRQGMCTAQTDPYDPYMCADESEAVEGTMATFRASFPQCVFSNERYEGSYGSPYVSVRNDGYGTVRHSKSSDPKYYKYSIWCPAWGSTPPRPAPTRIVQDPAFYMRGGFRSDPFGQSGLRWVRYAAGLASRLPGEDDGAIHLPVQRNANQIVRQHEQSVLPSDGGQGPS